MDAVILRINRDHKEVWVDFAVDRIHLDNKIQEVNNNNETQPSIIRNNVRNVVTNSDRTTCKSVRQSIKFVQNLPNGGTLPKCAVQETSIIWRKNEEQQEEIETESQETDPVSFAEFTSKDGWDEYQIDKFSVMAILETFEIKNTASLSEDGLNGHIV